MTARQTVFSKEESLTVAVYIHAVYGVPGTVPPCFVSFSFSSCEKESCPVISSRNPADFLLSLFRGPRHRRGHRDSVTMGDSLVLQVSGIPTSLLYKMVRDKLLIHFLRRSNGGDGEVDVRYPTEEGGVAILTFGHKEVAYGVLSRRHHLKIEGTTYPLEVIRLQCWGTQVSKPPMVLSLDDVFAGEDGGSDSNGRPGYRSEGSSRRRPKNTSTDDSTSIKKHPNIAANLNFHPRPPKKIPADEDRRPGRNSPLASNEKTADSPGLAHHTTFASTQFREDLPESGKLKDTFAADSSSSQSKPKGNIAYGFTSNPKHPIADGSDFNPGQPKNTSTDELSSNPKHSNDTIGDSTKLNSGQPKNTSTDELSSNPKHSKSTIVDSTKFNSGQPKNTSTDELSSNPKHSKSTIGDSTKFSSGQPKNTFTDEINSSPKHSNSSIGDGTKFSSGQPKNTSTDELSSNPKHSNSSIGDGAKFSSGQPKNTFTDEINSSPKHSNSSIGDGAKFSSGQPKNTSTDELNSNPKHSKSTIGDSTKFNSGQPKNTTDELSSNPKHSESTTGDSTKFSSGQPKNTSTDELNLDLKLPKNHLGDSVNFKPSNPQNSSPDEFLFNPRNPEELSTSSSNRSSLMAAGWSSSSSPTVNSSTATNPKNHLDQKPLSTEFLVDPAAHTYISVFMKDAIDDILGQSSVGMRTETGDGYNRVILTAKSPHLSQQFYKAARETAEIFTKCQSFLRVERIDLSNISAEVTRKLQFYLYQRGIWSSPNGESLQMIGPYEDIIGFMKKWTSAGGDFARFVHLSQEEVSPGSSRPPVVGMDNIHRSTTHDHNVTHDVHNRRARSDGRSEEPGARGGSRGVFKNFP